MAVGTQPPLAVPGSDRRDHDISRRLRPGWPLALAFIGYPIWWMLGLGEFVLFVPAACMAYDLLRRREILAPRGFGLWILFLAWVGVGLLVLQVDAPGAVPGSNQNRYFVWGFRLAWFLAATIVLLYVGNNREQLSTQRLTRIMSWMFLVITVGGLIGTLVPSLTFPSVLEVLLPQRISSIGFLNAQIHPTLAQAYDVQRPSAPFPYANEWGLNFALFLPFFVASWCHRDAGWRRVAAPIVLALAVIPVVYSLNRGLWLTLAVMAVFVALRSAATGHLRLLGALLVSAVSVAVLVAATPLQGMLESRVTAQNTSNEGRTNLVTLSLTSMSQRSPVVGYGTTRNVEGTFGSISGGSTVSCPLCSPPAMGTQGLLWLVAFSTGIGGLVLFLGFFVLTLFRHLRLRSVNATLGLSVLVAMFVTLPIYDLSGPGLFAVMVAVGLLWRDSLAQPVHRAVPETARSPEPSLRAYGALVRDHRALVAGCLLLGVVVGAGWQVSRGTLQTATVSLLAPTTTPAVTLSLADPDPTHPLARPNTLDTESQLGTDDTVLTAIEQARQRAGEGVGTLAITATENSRILHFTYTAKTAAAAKTGVSAAAQAYLRSKQAALTAERADVLRSLQTRSDAVNAALRTLNGRGPAGPAGEATRRLRADLVAKSLEVVDETQQVTNTPLAPGRVISVINLHANKDGWPVSISSGALLGLLAGISLGRLRSRRTSSRVRSGAIINARWRGGHPAYAVNSTQ